MRANHFVTLGLGIGIVGMCAAVGACGTDTSGTCMDTNSCGPGSEGGADTGSDVNTGGDTMEDTGPTESGGGDARTDAPSDGGAQCDAGLHECSGKCVNEGTDPNHCGSCTNVCPGPDGGMGTPGCDNGVCLVQCAGAGTQYCSGMCVSTTDVNHCGNCTTVCPPPMANGSAACAQTMNGDSCTYHCVSGYHACGMTCLSDGDDPSTDPCVVADGLGIFVSATNGDDNTGDGSKEKPYATIRKAADVAATGKKRVYACGTFTSGVALVSADDGVTIYGGLDCSTWAYSMSTPTTVSPPTGYALQVTGAATGIAFKDFVLTAASAPITPPQSTTTSAQSSIAVFANQSTLKLTRVQVNAGSGQPGAGGGSTTNWTGAAPAGMPGALITGGAGGSNPCLDGTSSSTGGTGGGVPGPAPGDGSSQPAVGTSNGGGNKATSCDPGLLGSNGLASSSPALNASASGTLGSTGWIVSSPGATAAEGNPGQGGGGGGSNAAIGAGGGGGAGGCGGAAGAGGSTGGSSIAILSFQAALTLTSCKVNSTSAGTGGSGGPGQDGQSGAAGGMGGGGAPQGCTGGNGGIGGGGGGGGGGAGGLSAGIVWSEGTAPLIDGVSISNQASGVGGFTTAAAASVGGSGGVSGQGGGNPGATGGSGASVQPADVLSM